MFRKLWRFIKTNFFMISFRWINIEFWITKEIQYTIKKVINNKINFSGLLRSAEVFKNDFDSEVSSSFVGLCIIISSSLEEEDDDDDERGLGTDSKYGNENSFLLFSCLYFLINEIRISVLPA